MAIIWYEHFDLYGLGAQNSAAVIALGTRGYTAAPTGSGANIVSTGRNGNCWSCTANGGSFAHRMTITPRSVLGVGAAFNVSSTPFGSTNAGSQGGFAFGTDAANLSIRVVMNADLGFSVYTGGGLGNNTGLTLVGSTPSGQFALNSWFWVEVRATQGAPGTIVVRINGSEYTFNTTVPAIGGWGIGMFGAATISVAPFRTDDWVVWDASDTVNNTWAGDTFVLVAPPNADGPADQWVASTGNDAFAMVDEASPDDLDFMTANAVTHAQEFSHVAVNLPAGAVAAIATQARAFKTDAGASSIQLGVNSNGASAMSGDLALSTGSLTLSHIANRNPDGNVPWTQAAAQAARFRTVRTA